MSLPAAWVAVSCVGDDLLDDDGDNYGATDCADVMLPAAAGPDSKRSRLDLQDGDLTL